MDVPYGRGGAWVVNKLTISEISDFLSYSQDLSSVNPNLYENCVNSKVYEEEITYRHVHCIIMYQYILGNRLLKNHFQKFHNTHF